MFNLHVAMPGRGESMARSYKSTRKRVVGEQLGMIAASWATKNPARLYLSPGFCAIYFLRARWLARFFTVRRSRILVRAWLSGNWPGSLL